MHLDPTRTRAQRLAAQAFMAMSLVLAQACAPEATQPEQDPSWTPKDPVSGQFFSESNPAGTGQTVPAPMAHPRTDVPAKVDVDQPIAPVRTPRPRVDPSTLNATNGVVASEPTAVVDANGDQKDDLQRDILLRSARNALKLGRFDEALALHEKLQQLHAGDRESLTEYAGLLVQAGRLAEARARYTELVKLAPSDLDARRSLATVLIAGGYYSEAASELETVVRRDPEDADSAALLARVLAWSRDHVAAGEVYRVHLQTLDLRDDGNRRLVAPVLLDLQRPLEALPHLQALVRAHPTEVEWGLYLVRCQAQLGDATEAGRVVESLAEVEPNNTKARIEVADQMVLSGQYKLAMSVYQQVLAMDANHERARLGVADVALASCQPAAAKRALDGLRTTMEDDRGFQIAQARYHGLVGERGAAGAAWEDLLRAKEDDWGARIAYADLLRESGEHERAKSQYTKVPEGTPRTREARLGLARTLFAQGLYEESVALCQTLTDAEDPTPEVLIQLARGLEKLKNAEQAERLCRQWLTANPQDVGARIQVRIALGRALVVRDRPVEAIREFTEAMKHPSGRTPECAYWLARAYDAVGSKDRARLAVLSAPMKQLGDDVRSWIELGEIALGEGDWKNAIAAFEHVLRFDPENLAARVRLGEAQNIALARGERVDPRRTLAQALAQSEHNSRARLAMARAYVVDRDYEAASKQYKLLMAADPSSFVAKREYARTLYWNHQYEEADAAYDAVVDENLAEVAPIDPYGKASSSSVYNGGLDYEAALTTAENVELERDAKKLKDYRPRQAEERYRELIAAEPANFEARFDLAQLYHSTGRTQKAIGEYEEIMRLSPLHREAPLAKAQAEILQNPRVVAGLYTSNARGRDGLYAIDITDYFVEYQHPIGDHDEYFGAGYGWRRYEPDDGTPVLGSMFLASGRKKLGEHTALTARLEMPTWDEDYVSSRLLYRLGMQHETWGGLRVSAEVFNEMVAENDATLLSDIHRTGFRAGLAYKSSPRLDYGVSGMIAEYSEADPASFPDDGGNSRYEVNAFGSYLVSFAPKQLQLLGKADFISFDGDNDGIVFDSGDPLTNLNHPYFAPGGYSVYSAVAEWKHWLNQDYFIGANEFWYSIGLRAAIDDESEMFQEFWIGAHYDFASWASVDLRTQSLSSSVLDTSTNLLYFTLRWP
jgi:tetratricopeptide (TPR) repeat protein